MMAESVPADENESDLVGATDIARRLGVSRQRVGQLRERADSPPGDAPGPRAALALVRGQRLGGQLASTTGPATKDQGVAVVMRTLRLATRLPGAPRVGGGENGPDAL